MADICASIAVTHALRRPFPPPFSPKSEAAAPDAKQMQILFLLFSELCLGLGQQDRVFFSFLFLMIPQFSAAITGNALIKCGAVLVLTSHALIHARLPEVVPLAVPVVLVPINLNIDLAKKKKEAPINILGCFVWSEMLALALAVLD